MQTINGQNLKVYTVQMIKKKFEMNQKERE